MGMRDETKSTLEPHLLVSEIKHRLLKAGCRDYKLGELLKARSWITGRNWTVHVESPDLDMAVRIVRQVGNDFDCQFDPKRYNGRLVRQ
jgi:hypothetical protein